PKSVSEAKFKIEGLYEKDNSSNGYREYNYKSYLKAQRVAYKTNYKFFKETSAYTQGQINLIIGRTGKGKTDLLISQAIENLLNNYNVYIFLSEVVIADFFQQASEILILRLLNEIEIENYLQNLIIKDLSHLPVYNPFEYKKWLNSLFTDIQSYSSHFFYLDNLTTIEFSRINPEVESGFTSELASLTKK